MTETTFNIRFNLGHDMRPRTFTCRASTQDEAMEALQLTLDQYPQWRGSSVRILSTQSTRPTNSALRTLGASVDAATHLPVSTFPSGAQMCEWDRSAPKSSI